jgi:hypothetical protein
VGRWLVVVLAGCGRIGFQTVGASGACAPADAQLDAATTGTTYYVATDGDDARPCSQATSLATPRKTLNMAFACLGAGDTLIVRGGVYAEEFNTANGVLQGGTSWDTATRIAAYSGETPIMRPNVGASRVLTLSTTASSYIVFDGFVFDDTNGASPLDAAVKVTGNGADSSHHIRFIRCEIPASPVGGFYFNAGASGSEIIDSRAHDLGTSLPANGTGIEVSVSDMLVERCEVYRTPAIGILLFDNTAAVSNVTVRDNLVHDGNERGIYVGGAAASSDEVSRNVVWNNDGGIFVAAPSSRIVHNTVVNNVKTANKFCVDMEGASGSQILIENNICWQQPVVIAGMPANATVAANLTTDPSFVNETGNDFDLMPSSAAIDAGVPLPGFTYAGAPDIGAFEQPFAVSATIDCGGSQVVIATETAFAPLLVTDCSGFAVHDGGSALPIADCRADGSNVDLVLGAASTTANLVVDYSGGGVTDGFAAGGSRSARLRPFTGLAVTK